MSTMFSDSLGGGADPNSGGSQAADDLLSQAVDLLKQYLAAPDSDPSETHVAAKALTALQGILATDHKNDEAASGTTPAHKGMAKQIKRIAAQVHGSGGGGY